MRFKLTVAILLMAISGLVMSAHRSTKEEASTLFNKAVSELQNSGSETAMARFNDKDGGFQINDLYVFALDAEGNYLASGANAKLVGTPFKGTVDAAGHSLYDMMIGALANEGKSGSISYEWLNRQTNQLEKKTSYLKEVDSVIIGVGYYH